MNCISARHFSYSFLAALWVFPTPNSATAQEATIYERSGMYLGLGASYGFHWFAGHSFDRRLGGRGVQVISSSSGGLNSRAGYRINSWLSTEVEYEWIEGITNKIAGTNVATLSSHQLTLNGKFVYPDWGRIQPYGLLGVGLSIWTASELQGRGARLDATNVGVAGRVGLGLDAYLNKNLLINLGLDMALSTTEINNSIDSDLENMFYIPIQLGIQYRF